MCLLIYYSRFLFVMNAIRIGMGYDVHRLVPDRDLFIGGVKIDYQFGLLGHSDADVLIHAICDAILGAANLRDIGFHFPDNDPKYKGADSKVLLAECVKLIADKGYAIANIDATVCAEKPKLNPFIPQMQSLLAEILMVDVDNVSIKATTTEGLGFVGNKEGIAAYAVALIYKL